MYRYACECMFVCVGWGWVGGMKLRVINYFRCVRKEAERFCARLCEYTSFNVYKCACACVRNRSGENYCT